MKIRNDPDGVRIVGIDIPFLNMVKLLVEIAVASIPAMIIIFLLILGFSFLLSLIGMAAGIAR